MFLNKDVFTQVIRSAPLVSIDLIIINENGEVLLGERLNRPAQGYWFVPGGRIQKNESLAKAFLRLTNEELGKSYDIEQATLQGPYDHFYDDCVFGETTSTHYVAISYRLSVIEKELRLPDSQHGKFQWWSVCDLLAHEKVHKHTKWYFQASTSKS